MAIFTAIGTAIAATFFAGSAIAASVIATGLSLAASFALSYAVKALSGKPAQSTDSFGVQGQLAGGGAVPRSFGLGYHATAGSLVYANFFGQGYDTPNALQCWVIAVSDLPEKLVGFHVNGQKITLPAGAADYQTVGAGSMGYAVPEYIRPHNGEGAPTPHLWIKYYDGSQTAADTALVAWFAANARPYQNTRVGKGVSYFIAVAFNDENLWNGFPTFKAELSGIALYDPSKDSTVGGSGTHRYADPSTWGGDGDDFPAVQAYAVLRGIDYAGVWLYGLQNTAAARLPVTNWITQIAKCRSTVTGDAGPEPSYRTGLQVNVDAQPANLLEALMTGCQGKISEVGGFYKCHLGAPDSPSFAFTDGDILSTESQTFRPFFALSDSVNGIQATYPDPSQGWNTATAPAYYRTDLEIRDGNRRLMASPAFDAVPYPEQVQRLQKSAIEEGQRARGHTITLPPAFWTVEPGDVGEWTSARNGYSAKQFRVDAGTDKSNLDAILVLTEVDPADYDWNRGTDLKPVTTGVQVSSPPPAQGIASFDAQAYSLVDDSGIVRRPAILISWDGSQPGISGVQFEVRLASDNSSVTRGRTDRVTAGNLIITQSILPDVTYQVRGQYIPSTPRDMLWSSWITVTTPDVRLSLAEFDAAMAYQVTALQGQNSDKIAEIENRLTTLIRDVASRTWLDKKELRSQLSARADDASAQIEDVRTVVVDATSGFASFSTAATATWGSTTAFVEDSASAIATLDGYAAAAYGVTLNVNGYATGFSLVNGGSGVSDFTVVADKFQFQLPGYNGGAPQAVFTIGTIGGVAAVGLRGNLLVDGSLNIKAIAAGSIDTVYLKANSIDSASGVIRLLGVDSLSIADNAVTVPSVQNFSLPPTTAAIHTFASFNLSINTAGLSGKPITVYATAAIVIDPSDNIIGSGAYFYFDLLINGTTAQTTGGGFMGPSVTLASSITITGTGGTVTVPIAARGYCTSIAGTYSFTGSCFAIAAKR